MRTYRIYLLGILVISVLCTSCFGQKEENVKKDEVKLEIKSNFTCNDFSCLQNEKNKKGNIEGFFRKYTPNKKGKGAGYMFWDWELLLADSTAVPVVDVNKNIDMSIYENKNVSIYANIFYGIIIGGNSSLEDQEQAAKGYRIDAISIKTKHNKK